MKPPTHRVAYTDGGSRGNPGVAGCGVYITTWEGERVARLIGVVGCASTNNESEYQGVLVALRWAQANAATRLHIRTDSKLVVQQLLRHWQVNHERLVPLYTEARQLMQQVGRVTLEHVHREQNTRADHLSNVAMDLMMGKRTWFSVIKDVDAVYNGTAVVTEPRDVCGVCAS